MINIKAKTLNIIDQINSILQYSRVNGSQRSLEQAPQGGASTISRGKTTIGGEEGPHLAR